MSLSTGPGTELSRTVRCRGPGPVLLAFGPSTELAHGRRSRRCPLTGSMHVFVPRCPCLGLSSPSRISTSVSRLGLR